ncbi:PKD-like family lipoprotein [Chitinophaga cymbidii]|uniref:Bacteroidetes PKD-like domain-containing protein n=1 Tax=Chitinophaga cymbidii TaxID=1096750 RepID=A0A512RSQ5_9BACT|nr:PKD-like family lipoprotein [Chitinophaga cymbidii]GEP98719.1 hypothetical protein CCY01nite_49790 [Chitinophaga cymbidii]
MKFSGTILSILLAALLTGCYKDKGNYDYKPINRLAVSDPANPVNISITLGDSLKITPVIEQSASQHEDSLSYEWMVFDNSPASSYTMPRTVISTDRNLAVEIKDPPFSLGQNYRLTYRVTDRNTGVSSAIYYNLTIINKYATGWILLESKPAGGDLSMILPDGSVERGIYTSLNPSYPLENPVKVELSPFQVTDDVSVTSRKIYLLGAGSGMELDYQTMLRKFDYAYLFYGAPAVIKPLRMTWMSTSANANSLFASQGIVINDGKVHANLVGGFPGSKKWGAALSTPEGHYNYEATPFVAGGTTYSAVIYDKVKKRFYQVGNTALTNLPIAASTLFDMNDVGLDMLYLDSANITREYNAVMKDASNVPWLLRFKLAIANNDPPNVTLQKTQMNAPGILNMTGMASSTITPHIYYATGNTMYRYETTSNTTVQQYTFPAGETVTQMKFLRQPEGASLLAAVTWDGTQGRLYFFEVSSVGNFSEYRNRYEGFGRIVDIGFKVP